MRVQDLLGEGELARGTEDAADFAEAAQQLLVRRCSRGDIDIARIRYGGGGSEASCLGGETGGEEVRLFKSVFVTTTQSMHDCGAESMPTGVEALFSIQLHKASLTLQPAAWPALSTCDRILSCLSVAVPRRMGHKNVQTACSAVPPVSLVEKDPCQFPANHAWLGSQRCVSQPLTSRTSHFNTLSHCFIIDSAALA